MPPRSGASTTTTGSPAECVSPRMPASTLATCPATTIAMEACGGAHLMIHKLTGPEHTPKLITPLNNIALRKNRQDHRGYQVRIRVAHLLLLCSVPFLVHSCLSWHYSILPILPKPANQPLARATTGLIRDPCCKTYLYVFGFTRNNA